MCVSVMAGDGIIASRVDDQGGLDPSRNETHSRGDILVQAVRGGRSCAWARRGEIGDEPREIGRADIGVGANVRVGVRDSLALWIQRPQRRDVRGNWSEAVDP